MERWERREQKLDRKVKKGKLNNNRKSLEQLVNGIRKRSDEVERLRRQREAEEEELLSVGEDEDTI